MPDDIGHRFAYHPPRDEATIALHQQVRSELASVAALFDQSLPNGREKALAITKLEEAMFWANGAIARSPG